jgi:predicted DsbA family dithiol-disulfide isomerase
VCLNPRGNGKRLRGDGKHRGTERALRALEEEEEEKRESGRILGHQRLTGTSSDYIQIRAPVYIPHSAGRFAQKRFRKAQCPIIERLTNSLMMNGRNNGKKLMAVRIVSHAFEIVRLSPSNSARSSQVQPEQESTH